MIGTCLCETVKFEIKDNVTALYQCHCKLCQKQSGSTSNTATIVKTEDFEWLEGEETISKWKKESGFTSHFCRTCGCPVPNQLRELNYVWLPMGLMEDSEIAITTHLCCSSKAPWESLELSGKIYDEMPPDLEGFVARLSVQR